MPGMHGPFAGDQYRRRDDMHCSVCHDHHAVTVEDADRWRRELASKRKDGLAQEWTMETNYLMTLAEVASYLRVHPRTVYRLLKSKELPGFRVGSDWRFYRDVIDHWRMERDKLGKTE
jgi:excisionase family DNA binding protein